MRRCACLLLLKSDQCHAWMQRTYSYVHPCEAHPSTLSSWCWCTVLPCICMHGMGSRWIRHVIKLLFNWYRVYSVRARDRWFWKIYNSIVFEFRNGYRSITFLFFFLAWLPIGTNAPTVQATKAHGGSTNVSHMYALYNLYWYPASYLMDHLCLSWILKTWAHLN